jgi:hypothetical protein
VIGIIAVLIAILLPALSKARQQAARTSCAAQMRQILTAVANYSAENKGFLPEYRGYNKNVLTSLSYIDSGEYKLWGLFQTGDLNLDATPPVVSDYGLGRLIVRKYMTNPKILICPAMQSKVNLNNTDRGGYFFNPHPAVAAGVPNIGPVAGFRTSRFKRLADYRKPHDGVQRCILTDFVYDGSVLVHSDVAKQIVKMNLGYADGSVKMVDSAPGRRGPWGRAAGTSWFHFRASDTIGYMEHMAEGKGISWDSSGNPIPSFGQKSPNNDSAYDPHDPGVAY